MPSTYSTSLRLELMADGEKSGTWGTITNTNLGTLIEQGVAGVASVAHDDSASYTLTTNNGSSDEARNAVVLMTGALTADREVIVPDVDKVYIFKNGTSGGFALTFKTSGGSGVTIPSGRAAICYVDSGTGTVNAIDDGYFTDSIYIEGSSAGDFITAESTNAGATSGPDIKLYRNSASPAGGDALSKITFTANTDDGAGGVSVSDVEYASITTSATETNETTGEAGKMVIALKRGGTTQNYIEIQGGTSADADNDSIVFKTGGIAVLSIDNNQDMLVDTDSKLQFRDSAIYIQSGSDGNLNIEADTAIAFDTDTLYIDSSTDKVSIGTTSSDGTLHVHTGSAGTITAAAAANDLVVESDDAAGISILFDDTNTNAYGLLYFGNETDGNSDGRIEYYGSTYVTVGDRQAMSFRAGNVERMRLQGTSVVFNETGADTDFRIESDGNTHALFVDAAQSTVGIGTSSTFQDLTVNGNIAVGGAGNKGIYFGDNITSSADQEWLLANNASNSNAFTLYEYDSGTFVKTRMTVESLGDFKIQSTAAGSVVINDDGENSDFRVESDNNANMLYVDASADKVSVGSGAPQGVLNVIYSQNNSSDWWTNTKNALYLQNADSSGQTVVKFNNNTNTRASIVFNTDGSGRFQLFDRTSVEERFGISSTELVINEDGANADFRIESDTDANFFVADADSGDSGSIGIHTNSPGTDLDIVGGMRSRYRLTNAPGSQTGPVNDNYWKLGTLTLGAVAAAEITLYGTASYSSGYSIAGKTTIVLRGGTSATLLDGTWWYEGEFTSGQVKDCVYVPTGTANEFDIYVKLGNYQCFDHEVITGGKWVSSIVNTGSSSPPSGYQLFSREYSIWNGDNNFWYWDVNGGVGNVFNENSGNIDFRVEGDGNAHLMFADASNDAVGFGTSSTASSHRVTIAGTGGDRTQPLEIIGTGTAAAFSWMIGARQENLGTGQRAAIFVGKAESTYNMGAMYHYHVADGSSSNELRWGLFGADDLLKLSTAGNLTVTGALSKGSGSFRIDHPIASKSATHDLVHSFVEAPQADNIYRGKVDLVAGQATVNIDTVAGMTEGTFVLLNREIQCFTSNETGWTAVRGSVSGNILTIEAQDNTCADTISWLVIGERQDQHMYDTNWTDENGKVIVEPEKTFDVPQED